MIHLRRGAHVTDKVKLKWEWAGKSGTALMPLLGVTRKARTCGLIDIKRVREEGRVQQFKIMTVREKKWIKEGGDMMTTVALAWKGQETERKMWGADGKRRAEVRRKMERYRKRILLGRDKGRLLMQFKTKYGFKGEEDIEKMGKRIGVMITIISNEGFIIEQTEQLISLRMDQQITLIQLGEKFGYIEARRLNDFGMVVERHGNSTPQ